MAELIGRTKSWAAWLAGAVLALIFSGAGCGRSEPPVAKYGPPPMPPAGKPVPAQPATSLEESADWKVITEAWDFCVPLATSGKSTEKQRTAATARLKSATAAAAALTVAGLLNASESRLLAAEAEKLRQEIYRNPPETEPGGVDVLCYDRVNIPPARQSLDRLSARLPLLGRLAAEGKLHRPAVEKILTGIEADVVTLSDQKQLAELEPDWRAAAERTRDAVRAEVEKLRKLLDSTPQPAAVKPEK